jgi:hypothetical protein
VEEADREPPNIAVKLTAKSVSGRRGAGKGFENQRNLVLDTLGPDIKEWSDRPPEKREEYIN